MSDTIKIFYKELNGRLRPSDLNQRESPTNKPQAEAALDIAGTFSCSFPPRSLIFCPLYGAPNLSVILINESYVKHLCYITTQEREKKTPIHPKTSDTIKIFLEELKERSRPSVLNQRESPVSKPQSEAVLDIAGTFSCSFLFHLLLCMGR
ncbi:hypothetical protein CDAR_570631 [Caerostris darwini]|uniref:Uncharacterized protein n=1 Tax=Caerostris darwini TaxID=1538125 RepID=A0AAV4QE50_9ARAC|nr:hypothetical protein CDAR_570631 [Caerostris darwini]